MTAISSTLLTGCFSNEREDIIMKAKNEYTQGNYEEARKHFEQASRMQSFNEKEKSLQESYQDILNKLYVQYYTEGNTQLEAKYFDKALENYEKAYAIWAEDEDLKTSIKETKLLLEEQKRLDNYLNFVDPIISSSNELLRGFNKDIDATVVGSLSQAEFISHVKVLIPKSNAIVAKIDDSFTTIDGEIAPVHQKLLDLMEYQHRTFTMALEGTSTKELSERYNEVKQQQTQLVQEIQTYANQKGIAYRINTSEEKSESTDSEQQSK